MRRGIDEPVDYRLPKARGRVLGRPDPLTWPVLLLGAGIGALVWAWASPTPGRAAGSYAVTIAIVTVCLATAGLNVRMANRISPSMALVAAMFSYLATVLLMLILLLASSPRVVDGYAVLAGCCVTVVVWTTGLVRASWVR